MPNFVASCTSSLRPLIARPTRTSGRAWLKAAPDGWLADREGRTGRCRAQVPDEEPPRGFNGTSTHPAEDMRTPGRRPRPGAPGLGPGGHARMNSLVLHHL